MIASLLLKSLRIPVKGPAVRNNGNIRAEAFRTIFAYKKLLSLAN